MTVNKTIQEIFEEYEQWLQDNLENKLNESSKDILDQINKILKDFEASLNYAYHSVSNGIHYIESKHVTVDGFLYWPTFYIFFTNHTEELGAFYDSQCYYDEITDSMWEARFNYFETKEEYPNIDYSKFREIMFHEIQHAYRHYQILKKQEENKEKIQNEKNIYQDVLSNNIISNLVKNVYYYTNVDEIDAHLSEMYPYLQQHKEITINNYKQYLDEIPGYIIIKKLKVYQNYFNNIHAEQYPKIKEQIGNDFYKIYSQQINYKLAGKDSKLTPSKCYYMTKNRVNETLLYVEKKFYRLLKEILNDKDY